MKSKNIAYSNIGHAHRARLESIRRDFGVTTLPRKEQVESRRRFEAYASTDAYKEACLTNTLETQQTRTDVKR